MKTKCKCCTKRDVLKKKNKVVIATKIKNRKDWKYLLYWGFTYKNI